MKPDTYFRHSGRPPCTHENTDASGSKSPPLDSPAEMDGVNSPPTNLDTGARAELGTGTSTSASQSADTQTKRRGRLRKSP